MKKHFLRGISYLLVAVLASFGTLVMSYRRSGKLERLEALIDQRFIGEADAGKMEDAAAAAMIAALDDRWSYYQTAQEHQNYLDIMSNSYVGVGITISLREDGQGLDIQEVTAEGPAAQAGVLAGDRLVAVDGESIIGMTTTEVSALVKGEENTAVMLALIRDGEELELTVTRKRLESVVATGQLLEGGIGLVTIKNFDDRCAEETVAVIDQLLEQGAEALIFDVRNNPGGYKREMVTLLDHLLPEGPLFKTVDYRGREEVDYSDADCLQLPMAVLVNLHSYSAAEFFAAALKEYDAVVTVGEQTFGKGYFQNTFTLKDGVGVIHVKGAGVPTTGDVSMFGVMLVMTLAITATAVLVINKKKFI